MSNIENMAESHAVSAKKEEPMVSLAFHPLAIGNPGDKEPTLEETLAVLSILKNAGICCFFVDEFALIYYGAGRVLNDNILCVPDERHQEAVQLFMSSSDLLEPCGPLPLKRPDSLNHKYPRFKAIGRTDFWLLVPASYYNIDCRPENVEWSKGGLPFPKLEVYAQSLIDIKNGVDLQDLIDAQDLSVEWGEENLNLEGSTCVEWAKRRIDALKEDGVPAHFIFIDPTPVSRRKIWQEYVENKQKRMGWKYPPEIYATRWRRHGSKDPRTKDRPGF
ncbi:hypothetical protein DTO169C6_5366 [Paecilomyces variotii]|nr:hypothetical protein DTO169C6_5366 [Paecilomyces variotii]